MEFLNIGIVGAGAIAQRNASESAKSGAAKIVGVFDVNHKVARDMSRSLSAPFFEKYEELIAQKELEAVLISTPHYLHVSQAIQAAHAGKHVMVEKPLANNLKEAEAIIAACEMYHVALTVNYSFRYLPKIRKAWELVQEGALGDITGCQILAHQFKDPGYWTGARSNSPDDWRGSREKSGGGLLIMTTCHAIDYVYYITGLRATRVFSEYGTLNSSAEVEDSISLTCRFENGAIGNLSASSIMRGVEQSEERIWGTKGTIILNQEGLQFYSTRPVDNKRPGKLYKLKKFPDVSWTQEWVRDFVKAVREGKTPTISAREGWENLAFITSAYESMEKQAPIIIPNYK